MPYKEELTLSEIEPYLLPSIKDFIEEILDLYEIYGDKVKIPVAIPPKKYTEMVSLYVGGAISTAYTYSIKGLDNDPIKGTYQDEAILRESADRRLNKIVMLKKLGAIRSIKIDNAPLQDREVSFYVEEKEMKELFNNIEKTLEKKEKVEKEYERKKNEIYYNYENSTINLDDKSVLVSGWEDAICKVVFNPSNKKQEIDFWEIIYEMTGEQYSKSEGSRYMESIRQAVYRINKKIKESFNKDNYLFFSTKTRKLTKAQTK